MTDMIDIYIYKRQSVQYSKRLYKIEPYGLGQEAFNSGTVGCYFMCTLHTTPHRTRRLDTEQTILALAAGSWSGTETAGRRLRCTL